MALVVAIGCKADAHAPRSRPLRIGTKVFTESVILGQIAAQLAAADGLATDSQGALGGTRVLWSALRRGEVDLYPEYTGTIVEEILSQRERPASGNASIPTLRALLATQGVGLIGPLGFDNNYALGMREDVAQRLGAERISDLRANPALRLGFSNEFMSRRDGWPRLRERYGLESSRANGMDHDLAYRALAGGSIDVTDLYSTDAEIEYYGLRVLRDDLEVFPRYEAVYLYRLAREHDLLALRSSFSRLQIGAQQMQHMNARAKLERVREAEVAAEFLAKSGLDHPQRSSVEAGRSRRAEILTRTYEHLALVGVSLSLAILVALPLGILCQRRPRIGRVILDAVGLVQTIPSLALLVFMIPLFGIGALPATIALFLYGLLPIVRNTYAGLCDVPEELRHVADALGLPPRARLRLIELPLASRAILAGIKSAAVINVGTATLGALIGAGGLGQPILTGIRLDDVGLILQGAIPASLLALGVERMFGWLERMIVPRGVT
jgi:osmoprotectant transport system permease protein